VKEKQEREWPDLHYTDRLVLGVVRDIWIGMEQAACAEEMAHEAVVRLSVELVQQLKE
tara:strand:+ start:82 stop:255 length:174 start_codon:yes stop_codon:yes gene_type:complete